MCEWVKMVKGLIFFYIHIARLPNNLPTDGNLCNSATKPPTLICRRVVAKFFEQPIAFDLQVGQQDAEKQRSAKRIFGQKFSLQAVKVFGKKAASDPEKVSLKQKVDDQVNFVGKPPELSEHVRTSFS